MPDLTDDVEQREYLAALNPKFFDDADATEARLRVERKRARSPAQRDRARKRKLVRTEQFGFRTTTEMAAMIADLRQRFADGGRPASVTEVLERAIAELHGGEV